MEKIPAIWNDIWSVQATLRQQLEEIYLQQRVTDLQTSLGSRYLPSLSSRSSPEPEYIHVSSVVTFSALLTEKTPVDSENPTGLHLSGLLSEGGHLEIAQVAVSLSTRKEG